MNSKQIVADRMKQRDYTYEVLAKKLGYKTISGLSERLRGKHEMRVDTLLAMLQALDCELIIRSTLKDGVEYVVTLDKDSAGESK